MTRKSLGRGQAAVEFALISVIALMVLLLGIQFAMIGQAALAVSQASDAIARYASINAGQLPANGSVTVNRRMPRARFCCPIHSWASALTADQVSLDE